MTLRELLAEVSYKSVFNFIYKEFLSKQKLGRAEIMEFDIECHAFFMLLRNAPQKDPEDNKIYLTHIDNKIDVCLFNEKNDEIFSLDSVDFKDIIDMEIYKAINIDDISTLAHIIYQIKSNN